MGVPISGETLIPDLLRSARLIGYANSLRAVRNAVERIWHDVREPQPNGDPIPLIQPGRPAGRADLRVPGALRRVEPRPGGARFEFESASLDVCLLAGGGAFVEWVPRQPVPDDEAAVDAGSRLVGMSPSYAVAGVAPDPAPADLSPDPSAGPLGEPVTGPDETGPDKAASYDGTVGWSITHGALRVHVDRRGRIAFEHRPTGEPGGHGGHSAVVRRDQPPRWTGGTWNHASELAPDAVVLGLGGRASRLDRRPGSYRLWNAEPGGSIGRTDDPLSICMPVAMVADDSGTHLACYDTVRDGTVTVAAPGEAGSITTRVLDGPLRYYVFVGTPAEQLDRFTALTGRPVLPPRWTLGYHQSRWGYGDERTVRRVLDGFAEHDLPLAGLWLDIDHLNDYQVFTIDEKRYPDLAGVVRKADEHGVHLVSIVDPGVKAQRGVELYDDGLDKDVFCRNASGELVRGVAWPGTCVYPDFTSPRVRDWWGAAYAERLERGFDGVWHDMNEPSSFVAFGEPTLPLSTRHDMDGRGGDHREAHNVYGLTMNQAGYDALRRLRPDQRPFLISRAGWTGMQRYSGTWTGDIETSWYGLTLSVAFTVGLGVCGVPYSGPDIGGFTRHPSAELFRRWFQLAAYLPFFRTHSASALPPREPWEFGPEVLAELRGLLLERARLLPYWYTLAWRAHRAGTPYVRPLLWDDPTDPELRGIDDAFLLGDAFLVAPVLGPEVRSRPVRLPAGRWYDRRTGTAYDGPAAVEVEAPLDVIPVFARAGAVVPVEEDGRIVLEVHRPVVPADAVPGTVLGGGELTSDAGDGYEPPVDERFTLRVGPDGVPTVGYAGPAAELPYPVRWLPR